MRRGALALALLAATFALTLLVRPWSDERVNDLYVYRSFAEPVLHGALPYRDAFLEYPPLAAPAIALPGVMGTGERAFRLAFAGWTLLHAAAVLLLAGVLAERGGGSRTRAMLALALAPLLTGAMIRTHFDLAPMALVLGALALLAAGRPRVGLATLGLATMTKGFPLAAAPVALAWVWAQRGRREALASATVLLAVVAVLTGLALAASPSGAVDALRFQTERPVQVESSPALFLRGLDGLGLGETTRVKGYRSDGLEHPTSSAVVTAFGVVLAATLAALAAAAARRPGSDPEEADRRLVLASLASLAAFAALGKVLSPQYLIWALPLGALAFAWRMHALAALVVVATGLTLAEFPGRYFELVHGEGFPIALVALRNLALLAAIALVLRELAPIRSSLKQPAAVSAR